MLELGHDFCTGFYPRESNRPVTMETTPNANIRPIQNKAHPNNFDFSINKESCDRPAFQKSPGVGSLTIQKDLWFCFWPYTLTFLLFVGWGRRGGGWDKRIHTCL